MSMRCSGMARSAGTSWECTVWPQISAFSMSGSEEIASPTARICSLETPKPQRPRMKPSRSTAKSAVRAKPRCSEATRTISSTTRAGAVSPLLRWRRMPASRRTVSIAEPPAAPSTVTVDCGLGFTSDSTLARQSPIRYHFSEHVLPPSGGGCQSGRLRRIAEGGGHMRWRVIPLLLILGGGLWTALGQYIYPGGMDGDMAMGGFHDSDIGMTMGGLTGHSATVFCWVAGGGVALIALVMLAAEVRGARRRARQA